MIEQERLAREAEELRRAEEEAEIRQAQLQEQARKAEELRRAREEAEIRQAQLQEKLQKQEHWKGVINSARYRVKKLSSHGEIDKELAKEFIRESACSSWNKKRRMDHAAGHEENIYGSPNDWRIKFGANHFLVGKAIWRCQQTILDFIEKAESGYVIHVMELRESLENNVHRSVANHEKNEYEGLYSARKDDFLIFGTQAIKISSFVNLILRKAKLEEIFQASKS